MAVNKQNGQILLITLLVLSVALTIALSLIGRSTTDSSISTQVEESSRAFSAAEAGIEQALKLGSAPGTITLSGSNTTVNVSQQDIKSELGLYTIGTINNGDASTIWLVPHLGNGNLDYAHPYDINNQMYVCWNGNNAAIEITVYYRDNTLQYQSVKTGFDGNPLGRSYTLPGESNHYLAAGAANCGGGVGTHGATINFKGGGLGIPDTAVPIFMRLRPVYSAAELYVYTGNSGRQLPGLGNTFISCGSSVPGVTRCISANQLYPEPPEYFDYVLYANSGSIN
jgi:hypothetical protein